MIKGSIALSEVDYGESFKNLFPLIMKKTSAVKDPGMAIRFINKMGEDSLPIVLEILSVMSREDKAELISCIINQFRGRICAAVNNSLDEHGIGGAIQFGSIGAERIAGGIRLLASGVTIDYKSLADSALVGKGIDTYAESVGAKLGLQDGAFLASAAKFVLKTGATVMSGQIEKKGVEIINRGDVNKKLSDMLTGALNKFGLVMTVDRITLEQDDGEDAAPTLPKDDTVVTFPRNVEESLMDAVVSYLKTFRVN